MLLKERRGCIPVARVKEVEGWELWRGMLLPCVVIIPRCVMLTIMLFVRYVSIVWCIVIV
jgi:hypothetical protein